VGEYGFDKKILSNKFNMITSSAPNWELSDNPSSLIKSENNRLGIKSRKGNTDCLESVSLEQTGKNPQILTIGNGLTIKADGTVSIEVNPTEFDANSVNLVIKHFGNSETQTIPIKLYEKAPSITSIEVYFGDRIGVVNGERLDQIKQDATVSYCRQQPENTNNRNISSTPCKEISTVFSIKENGRGQIFLQPDANIAESGAVGKLKVSLKDGRELTYEFKPKNARPVFFTSNGIAFPITKYDKYLDYRTFIAPESVNSLIPLNAEKIQFTLSPDSRFGTWNFSNNFIVKIKSSERYSMPPQGKFKQTEEILICHI
jgi:hypothetical protein